MSAIPQYPQQPYRLDLPLRDLIDWIIEENREGYKNGQYPSSASTI